MVRLDEPRGFGGLRIGVLDRLRFVEHHVMELMFEKLFDIAAHEAVARDDHVMIGERFA